VKEWGEKVPEALKTRIDAAVERSRKALRGDDVNEIRGAQEELSKAYSEAGQAFYQQQSTDGSAGAPGADGAPSGAPEAPADDVAEADYEIVDEKK
jgi:molecular chaperone DnaK